MYQKYNRYRYWNYTTACCFKYKAHCSICPNEIICSKIKPINTNEYGIRPAKYAMLKTYAISTESYITGLDKEDYLERMEIMNNNWTKATQEYEYSLSEPPKSEEELLEEYEEYEDYLETKADADYERYRLERD